MRPEVEKTIEETEARMRDSWNGRGEPWCVFDPNTGTIVAEGSGILVLRHLHMYCKDVTSLFENLTPQDLGLDDFTDIKKSWLEDHATYGNKEEVFSTHVKKQLDNILDTWERASREAGTGLMLCLCHEANIEANVDKKTLAGKVVSHYHPTADKGLSKEDRRAYEAWNLLELRVVTTTDKYTFPENRRVQDGYE